MISRMNCLTEEELRREVAELAEELHRMKRELDSRSGEDKIMYQCEECGFRHENDDVVFDHLTEVHCYPAEDAGLSTIQIFV